MYTQDHRRYLPDDVMNFVKYPCLMMYQVVVVVARKGEMGGQIVTITLQQKWD